MTEESARDAGYDDFLDAVEDGSPYYLECPQGHGSLPPRHVCPECGASELDETELPTIGSVAIHNVVHVPTPRFVDDTPYVTAIVDFGPVSVTGQVIGVDPQEVQNGMEVTLKMGRTETADDRLIVFEPT